METHEENEAKSSAGDEIIGLNAEETYKAEKQLQEEPSELKSRLFELRRESYKLDEDILEIYKIEEQSMRWKSYLNKRKEEINREIMNIEIELDIK